MLSAIIITLNEEANINRCIEGLRGIADEVVVVDSGSTDATTLQAEALGARVLKITWKGYADARNQGAEAARFPIILAIDADEVPDEKLRTAILAEKALSFTRSTVFRLSRVTQYAGRWIRHGAWYPDRIARLYHRGHFQWQGDFVHEILIDSAGNPPPKMAPLLNGELLHYSYPSVDYHRRQIERYSTLAAQAKHSAGKRAGPLRPFISAGAAWLSGYILRAGFLDGRAGWQIAALTARERWLRYQKLRGMR